VLKVFKHKLPQQEQGFTLVEVLVSILIATVFVATAMQAMVVAALFKAKARQYAEATTWIQEDLESVKNRTARLQNTSLITNRSATDTTLEVASTDPNQDGFRVGDTLTVGTDSTNNVIGSIRTNTNTKALILTSALGTDQLNGARVVATTKCNAATQDTGFADHLRDNLPTITSDNIVTPTNSNQGSRRITGQTHILTRYGPIATGSYSTMPNVRDTAPYNVMEIKYEVKPQGGGNAIATMYTEVIPDAAFQCP